MKLLISMPANKKQFFLVRRNEMTRKINIKISETLGTRHYMTFMLFLGMANAYIMRTNMSIAIVSMVRIEFISLLRMLLNIVVLAAT